MDGHDGVAWMNPKLATGSAQTMASIQRFAPPNHGESINAFFGHPKLFEFFELQCFITERSLSDSGFPYSTTTLV